MGIRGHNPPSMDYAAKLTEIQAQGLYRQLQTVAGPQEARIQLGGREVINFCSNNYLGLATDPQLAEAATKAILNYGWGSGSAALIAGMMSPHQELQQALADFFSVEAALLFNSGYHANIGAIPALADPAGAIFSDSLNHASIIDGCRLARCPVHIYEHGNTDQLESLLKQHSYTGQCWVLSESIFSMDGDIAPLAVLGTLAQQYNCGLYLDEAHAVGFYGPEGRGVWEAQGGTAPELFVRIGTLGKAFGSYGAFALGSRTLMDYLINHARSFIYTTALPPAVAAASAAAVRMIQQEPQRRIQLQKNLGLFEEYTERCVSSPIIPWLVPGNTAVLAADRKLLDAGFYAHAIRSPTVKVGTERLRITLSAMHTEEQIAGLAKALKEL